MQKYETPHLARLDHLKAKLDAYRPLPTPVIKNLRDNLLVNWTYETNAIEGNTLTLKETKVVLEGITVGGKQVREMLEAINHQEAIFMLEEAVSKKAELSEWLIKSLHHLILRAIDDAHAGVYRTFNVAISGAQHTPPESIYIASQMQDFVKAYQTDRQALHPVIRAAYVHGEFVKIHPFADGNGRTSRLLMNFELMKNGFPPAVIRYDQRLAYYEALDLAHTTGDYAPFVNLVCVSVEQAFEPYWMALGVGQDT